MVDVKLTRLAFDIAGWNTSVRLWLPRWVYGVGFCLSSSICPHYYIDIPFRFPLLCGGDVSSQWGYYYPLNSQAMLPVGWIPGGWGVDGWGYRLPSNLHTSMLPSFLYAVVLYPVSVIQSCSFM